MKQLFTTLLVTCLLSMTSFAQFSTGIELKRWQHDLTDVAVGDLDNDGWNDVVIFHSQEDEIGWFRNLGNGQYALQEYIGGMINVHSVRLSDIDSNGYVDVIAATSTEVRAYMNQGNGQFIPQQLATGSNFMMRIDDIDNDGDMDLFTAGGSPANVNFYENVNGTFALTNTFAIAMYSLNEIRFADIDGDNLKDMVICSNWNNTVGWYPNLGSNVISTTINAITATQNQPTELNVGDLDNDGDIDVVAGSMNAGSIVSYANDGIGNFGPQQVVSTTASTVKDMVILDLNGDNYPEIISNHLQSPYMRLAVYGNAGGTFSHQQDLFTGYSALRIVTADMSNNGHQDFVSIESGNRLVLIDNLGANNFSAPKNFSSWINPARGRFFDVDTDGDLDLLVYDGDRAYWMENLGDDTYGAIFHYYPSTGEIGASGNMRDALMADFDNDGNPDLVVSTSANGTGAPSIFYFPGLGNGQVGAVQNVTTTQPFVIELHAADINNDGYLDLLAGASADAAYYLSNGNGTFGSKVTLGAALWCRAVYSVDMDNDGLVDILYASEQDDAVYFCKNNGGSFAAAVSIASGNDGPNGIYAEDLDGDNDMDLLVASRNDNKVSWYENLGGGTFSTENTISGNFNTAFDVIAADFDIDGDMDVAAVAVNDSLSWFENYGGGTFGPRQTIGTLVYGEEGIDIADYDNDGDMDILEVNYSFNSIRILENFNISEMQIKGRVFVDTNYNAQYDSLEFTIPQLTIESVPPVAYSYSYPDGRYFMNFNGIQGAYSIQAQIPMHWTTTTPSSYIVVVDTNFNSLQGLDFGFIPDSLVDTLETAFIGGFPRCNDIVNYWVDLENIGTTFPTGIIDVELDDSLGFVSANIVPDSVVGQHLYWSYDSLYYFETMQLQLQVQMPDFNSMGDSIISYVHFATDTMGTIVWSTTDTLGQVVTCAYDPNDKAATPAGIGTEGYIWPAPETIDYLIRFQNTGNDTAFTIVIKDQLDTNLDWNSLHPIAGSHSYVVERTPGGEVSFIFEDIMLPDSNVNEVESHGFILYSIDVLPNLPMGTVVENTAYIYFDLNPPVITNTKVHTFDTLATSPNGLAEFAAWSTSNFSVYPNPFSNTLTIRQLDLPESYSVHVYDLSGKEMYRSDLIAAKEYTMDLRTLEQGMYIIQLTNAQQEIIHVQKVVRQ